MSDRNITENTGEKKAVNNEWIYPLADPLNPHQCSKECKMPDTKAGCLGCPLA